MGPGIFSTKCPGLPKLEWALDLFTRWPHYKMTYKNPFCSGLKTTHSVWEIASGIQMLLQNAATRIQMRNDSPKVPPKGALQNAKSWGKIFKKPEFWKQHGSTTKCQTRCIFFMKKWCWYKMHGPGRLPRTIFGPNLLCSKPGLTYFVGEIQTPMKTHHFTICRWFVRWKPCIFHIELSTFARQGTSSQHIPARLMGELMLQWIQ